MEEGDDIFRCLIVWDEDSCKVIESTRKERCKKLDRVREIDCNVLSPILLDVLPNKIDLASNVSWTSVRGQNWLGCSTTNLSHVL